MPDTGESRDTTKSQRKGGRDRIGNSERSVKVNHATTASFAKRQRVADNKELTETQKTVQRE